LIQNKNPEVIFKGKKNKKRMLVTFYNKKIIKAPLLTIHAAQIILKYHN
jgi:hypothetical protein